MSISGWDQSNSAHILNNKQGVRTMSIRWVRIMLPLYVLKTLYTHLNNTFSNAGVKGESGGKMGTLKKSPITYRYQKLQHRYPRCTRSPSLTRPLLES
jgi:hypothetical protein